MSGGTPLVVNGWTVFAHPIFLDQLAALTAQVETLKRKDPSGYVKKNATKRLATNDQKQKAWENATTVRGRDPDLYRNDPDGNLMFKPSYGKGSELGWDVDHITPKSRGGSDATRDLQALNSGVNRSKGDSLQRKSRHSK